MESPVNPPPLPAAGQPPDAAARRWDRRYALALNLLLPGSGQLYLGQRVLGAIYAVGFLACFAAALGVFLRAYHDYLQLSTSDDILGGDLEPLARVFHPWLLVGLLVVAVAIWLASVLTLRSSGKPKP